MTTDKKDPFAEWKSLDFWKKQSIDLVPMITGLAVTGRMGIHGFAAIPVFILAADVTRWVIKYLEPELVSAEKIQPIPDEESNTKIAYTVMHTIPGRIRFSIPQIARDSAYAQRLETSLKADDLVTNVRVNSHAASIVIAYQCAEVSISHWVEIIELALQKNPSTDIIPEIGNTKINHPKNSSLLTDLNSASLSYSLGLMANLPVSCRKE
ncbi:HMA2 domain-containing protein [Anabaena sp. WFMT]|uniref:HMA2 domain-containing protein n=1 Tax=Anabaena sp. WFMT TaxID=3449730 RepID=UPI003F240880